MDSKNLGDQVERTLDTAAQAISALVMTMTKDEKFTALKSQPEKILQRIFNMAEKREDFEVCQVIKEIRERK